MAVMQELYQAPPAARPALQRIRRLSLPFEIVFAALAIIDMVLLSIIAWIVLGGGIDLFGGVHIRISEGGGELILGDPSAYPGVDPGALPQMSRVASMVVLVAVLGSQIGAFYGLHKLFGIYRRGLVFARESIRWMRVAGFLLIAAGLAPLLSQPLVRAAGLLDQRWFHNQGIAFLLVGAALFVLANVISLGREIEKEGEGYV